MIDRTGVLSLGCAGTITVTAVTLAVHALCRNPCRPDTAIWGNHVRHVFGSRKRSAGRSRRHRTGHGDGPRRLRRKQQQGLANDGSSARGERRDRVFASVGGNGALPGLYTTTAKPVEGGKMTFALDAESTGGWCLPEAQLVDRRHPGRPVDLRLPHRPRRQGRLRPEPRRQDHARTPTTRRGRSTCARASSSPTARRSTRRSSRTTSTRTAARSQARSPLLFVFVFEDIKPTSRSPTR